MAVPLLGNFFQSTLSGTLTSGATSATLASTSGFVVPGSGQFGIVRVDDVNAAGYNQITGPFEIIYFTGNNTGTNTLSGFSRGQEGTSAHAFAAGSVWSQVLTVGSLNLGFPRLIAQQTLGSVTNVFPAVSVPNTFRHLLIVAHVQHATAVGSPGLRLNGDTAADYGLFQIFSTGAGAQGPASSVNTWAQIGVASSTQDCGFLAIVVDYNSTAMAAHPILGYALETTGAQILLRANWWNQGGTAVTSVQVMSDQNMTAASNASIYGMG